MGAQSFPILFPCGTQRSKLLETRVKARWDGRNFLFEPVSSLPSFYFSMRKGKKNKAPSPNDGNTTEELLGEEEREVELLEVHSASVVSGVLFYLGPMQFGAGFLDMVGKSQGHKQICGNLPGDERKGRTFVHRWLFGFCLESLNVRWLPYAFFPSNPYRTLTLTLTDGETDDDD
ncbi:hypothetical protein CEXT_118931 [Caerostris extrusa]|uniref:Uncharacterized protein n=1 Tax=Caerostris extrusa TaxID=172846 RepID=A0AAV4Y2N1_CAEEX|nr:hypothetical protein CEXT_118931 [Caerostris extrusa]